MEEQAIGDALCHKLEGEHGEEDGVKDCEQSLLESLVGLLASSSHCHAVGDDGG